MNCTVDATTTITELTLLKAAATVGAVAAATHTLLDVVRNSAPVRAVADLLRSECAWFWYRWWTHRGMFVSATRSVRADANNQLLLFYGRREQPPSGVGLDPRQPLYTVDMDESIEPTFVRDLTRPDALNMLPNGTFSLAVVPACHCCTEAVFTQNGDALFWSLHALLRAGATLVLQYRRRCCGTSAATRVCDLADDTVRQVVSEDGGGDGDGNNKQRQQPQEQQCDKWTTDVAPAIPGFRVKQHNNPGGWKSVVYYERLATAES